MSAVAGGVDPAAAPVPPSVTKPTVVTRVPDSRRGILGALVGVAQFGSVLDADVLKAVMDEHGYSTASKKRTS